MAEPWPPAPAAASEYAERPVNGGRARRRLRRVRLWGRDVWYDDGTGRVWCDGCWELVTIDDLRAIDNSHPVGLPSRAEGRTLPLGDDPEAPRSEWDLLW